jgi:hypothetical protein
MATEMNFSLTCLNFVFFWLLLDHMLNQNTTRLCALHFIFILPAINYGMNKRFVIVGIVLGIIVTIAVLIGSPAIGGFDSIMR